MERKTKIILTRKKSINNRLRSFFVLIDGQKAGAIANGQTEEFVVTPGIHKIECRVNWTGSQTFEVNVREGESEYLQVRSGMKFFGIFLAMVLLIFGAQLYFRFTKTIVPQYFDTVRLVAAALVIAYFLYYLTLGRKQYLIIDKDSSNIFAK